MVLERIVKNLKSVVDCQRAGVREECLVTDRERTERCRAFVTSDQHGPGMLGREVSSIGLEIAILRIDPLTTSG